MTDFIFLALLVFFTQLGISGGLYETLAMYPRWRKGVTPENLTQRLSDSGQLLANKYYWPFVSLPQALLSIINIVLAWQSTGDARIAWLAAALIIVTNRIVTLSFFAPTMVRKFQHSEKMDAQKIQGQVDRWLALSRLRTIAEFVAWILGIWALYLLR